ncbi:hydrogenase maturation protease [Thiorhodococcus mannitoliphagus]|uniref:Hydrogenase maturation protease n=1 Tax=Thiorhodococcus mannitoliphagus TaxID=329406 RepID=A0A6P1DTC3_9GAMM|nr:hydrogenase maturation protease [Thiorhodococcus mannitoliphagus]NEX20453.1 hydrogenase maturation protease [Thiorhodococcus mannitoliphagus]
MKTLIIGYGSPIRGDDALGPLAADRLAGLELPSHVEVASRHVLTAEMVADLADKDLVIFLDAAVDLAPGEVRCQPLAPDEHAVSTMAHFLDPRELLAWCETLYQRVPDAYLITGGGDSFDYASYELTPIAESAIEKMLDTVNKLLAREQVADRTSARPQPQALGS